MSKFFLFIGCLQALFASVAFAATGHGQVLEETFVSGDWRSIQLEEAFADIQRQSDFYFTYNYERIKHITISTAAEEVPLLNLLKYIANETDLVFHIEQEIIYVQAVEGMPEPADEKPLHLEVPEPQALLAYSGQGSIVIHEVSSLGARRAHLVRGQVTGAEGEPLVGATILVKETGQGTVTDLDGTFSLSVPDEGTYTVLVSYVGYESKELQIVDGVTDLNIVLEQRVAELGAVVVRGVRRSLANALAIKQEAVNTVDAIVAEDIAKFPQSNISEALQRISGIQIRRDYAGGVGNEVSVRGLPPEYTQVTLNGQAAPNTSDNRTFNFNALPAELYARAEVYKTPMANMDEGGIGGTVNLVTRKPFDLDGQIFVGSLEGIFNTQAQDDAGITPKATLTYGNNWGDRFGILAGVSYNKFYNASEGYDVVRYQERSYDIDGDGADDFTDVRVPLPRYVSQGQEVERLAFNFAAQYQVTDNFNLLLDAVYANNKQTENRYTPIFFIQGPLATDMRADGNFLRFARFEEVRQVLENQQQTNDSDNYQASLTGSWRLNDWRIRANATYTASNRDSERFRYYADNYNTATFSVEDDYRWFTYETPTDLTDASLFTMNEARRYLWDNNDDIVSGQLDFTRELGQVFTLDFGGKYRTRTKSRTQFYDRIRNINEPFAPVGTTLDGFLDNVDEADGPSSFLVHDWDQAFEQYGGKIDVLNAEQVNAYYDITEAITAGYAMGTVDLDRFDANFGLRVVNTALTSKGFDLDEETDLLTPRETTASYVDVLPSINLRYELADNLFARAAFARVMTRPALGDLSAYREIDDVNLTISAKNPELDPFRANQYDLGLEWYPVKEVLLGVTFFRKDIESFITNEVVSVDLNGTTYQLSRPVNGNEAAINGIELNYQQPLTFLPSPLDGFGVVANYTLSDSNFEEIIDLGTGETESYELPNNSRHSANAILYYEKYGFQFRIAYNYRSEFLRSKPVPADGLKYRAPYSQTDLSLGYDLTDNISLTLNILNAFNSEPYEYIFEERFQDNVSVFGRTFQFGARFSL